MDFSSLQLLAVDLKTSAVVLLEYTAQTVTTKLTFPADARPLLLQNTGEKIYFFTADTKKSVLYIASTVELNFTTLPVSLPAATQATLSADGSRLYFTDNDNTLSCLNTASGELTQLGRPADASCVGLCTDNDGNIHTAWETQHGAAAATFNAEHKLSREYYLTAIPTNIACQKDKIYMTFTQSPIYGEGVAIFSPQNRDTICSFYKPHKQPAFQLYPCNISFSPDGSNIHIINEDAASITSLNDSLQITDYFTLGHSISALQFTGDYRFAVGGSNMFADLLLLDMVNKKILSISSCSAEFSSLFCLLD